LIPRYRRLWSLGGHLPLTCLSKQSD
jgi:hypothetical protein